MNGYNIWPFAAKDWETGIPMWRIEDFGVSQHGYSPRLEYKWLLLGFKARIGRDMNPQHTDIWRACGFQHTCGKGKPDPAWHELEIKTFILGGLSYGITPWHSTIAGPVDLTARIHADVARRERYFSRDYVAHVGVLCSQNTHDFYGHIPGTDNLNDYRDGLIGTWMALTENHVPFEFVFDNQIESAIPRTYKVLVLPNAAAMSQRALNNVAQWVRKGGRLIATADTACYDEWGEKLATPRLKSAFGIEANERQPTSKTFGQGKMAHLPIDPGLAYCRSRKAEPVATLIDVIRETPMPFSVEAPPWLVVNMFRSPDPKQLWVHCLNVSPFMPNGDSGFRGLNRPVVPVGTSTGVGGSAPAGGKHVGRPVVPARNVVFRLHGQAVESARLVVAGRRLPVNAKSEVVIPSVELHDVLVLTLR